VSVSGKAPAREAFPDIVETGPCEPAVVKEPTETPENFLVTLQLFWQQRKFLWRVGASSLLASALIAFLIPARYESVTRLMPPDGQVSTLGMLAGMGGRTGMGSLGAVGGLASDLLSVKSSGALFVGIVHSQTVQDSLIEQFNLKKVYGDSKIEDARKDLTAHTDVSEDRKSGIVTITVTDRDPKRAAAMAQTYVVQLDNAVARVSTSAARRERIFLEGRLKDVKQDLDASARRFSDFASKNIAIDIPAQGKAMVEAAAILQGQLIAAQSELRGLEEIYTGNNVRVRSLQARVKELRQQLDKIGAGDTTGGETGGSSLYPSIRRLPLLGVTYFDLYRETKIQENVYESLTQQYEAAKVQEAKEIPSVKVLDQALVPTKKSFPPRMWITMLGTMLALLAAMIWIRGKTHWDAMDARDPRKVLATEVFAGCRGSLSWFSANGSNSGSDGHQKWGWTAKQKDRRQKTPKGEDQRR